MFEINPTALPFSPLTTGTSVDGVISAASWDGRLGIDFEGVGPAAGFDAGVFNIPFKCDVEMAMMAVTEGFQGSSSGEGEVRFDRRFTAGSDTGRSDGDVGRILLGQTGISAQGDVGYDLAGVGVSLEPGMQVVVQVLRGTMGGSKSGKAIPMLLVRYIPETRSNMSALNETA